MSGNVWEWCLTNYDNPIQDAKKEDLTTKDWRVLRGGSWYNSRDDARSVYRDNSYPDIRVNLIGFRVVSCVRPPSP